MPYQVFSLAQLESAPPTEPVFIEAAALPMFLEWMDEWPDDSQRARRLQFVREQLKLRFFSYQHQEMPEDKRRRIANDLRNNGIQLEGAKNWRYDSVAAADFERLCFAGDSLAHARARFLMAARHARDGQIVHLIAGTDSYARLPHTVCYLPDKAIRFDDWPEDFDPFGDLRLHPDIRRAAISHWTNREWAHAVNEAIKTLNAQVQKRTGSAEDGFKLMKEAFSIENTDVPKLLLNPLASSTEENEQKGYHRLYSGLAGAFRNPISHGPVLDEWLQKRFGDKRTALKTLCFLSLLYEKLDSCTINPATMPPTPTTAPIAVP